MGISKVRIKEFSTAPVCEQSKWFRSEVGWEDGMAQGFRIQGVGFRVWGLRFGDYRVWGLGYKD